MEEIKELIAKIQEEGVKKAEEKALKIEEEAKKAAGDILHKARTEAEKIIQAAKEASTQMQQATQSSLQQAGRDLILSLKKEINALLEKMISHQIRQALKPEELNKIILALVKEHSQKEAAQIEILLNKEDLEKLEEGFLEKLKGEVKKGVLLKPSEDILAGFLISYDSGKSFFDFTDQALVEYIGNYLKPQLAGILK
jgi:V/A-type H+-transporting ATPase subunit E